MRALFGDLFGAQETHVSRRIKQKGPITPQHAPGRENPILLEEKISERSIDRPPSRRQTKCPSVQSKKEADRDISWIFLFMRISHRNDHRVRSIESFGTSARHETPIGYVGASSSRAKHWGACRRRLSVSYSCERSLPPAAVRLFCSSRDTHDVERGDEHLRGHGSSFRGAPAASRVLPTLGPVGWARPRAGKKHFIFSHETHRVE